MPRRRGPWTQAAGRFARRPLGVLALAVFAALCVTGFLAGKLAPAPPAQIFFDYISKPVGPSLHGEHLLGTDGLGHDELSQTLYALRASVEAALICAVGATAIGTVVGAVAGYAGGILDALAGWVIGVIVTMPALATVILVVVYNLPFPTIWYGVVLMLVLWPGVARVVRSEISRLDRQEFAEAARAAGGSALHVVGRHLIPNATGAIVVAGTATLGQSILIVATVDFFNYAVGSLDHPTLGGMVSQAITGIGIAKSPWWLYAVPATALGLLLVSANFAADSLDDALNPVQP